MSAKKKHYVFYRTLEIIPGALVWVTFIGMFAISFFYPILAIYFIILFDLYWLLRVSYLMIYVMISWRRFRKAAAIDWQDRLQRDYMSSDKNWGDYWHVIFLPTAGEPYEIIQSAFRALKETTYGNKKKMIVALAGEERFKDDFLHHAEKIKEEFGDTFFAINVTVHPIGLPGDMPGKGSNLYFAGHEMKRAIDNLGIDYKKIIVSTFDIDTIPHPQYFSYLTYHFLTHPNPYRASFQPLTLYHNNIWESDVVTRVVANSTTFWLLTDLARSERLFTFSSHSMSWQALTDIGFWQNNIVTEDSRIFLQCLMHYDGDYQVYPMYITVSMNTVFMGSLKQSLINQYKQMRRWAYGVEHFPYMVWHFVHNKKISLKKKIIYLWNQTEGVYSWSTAPIIMFVVGHIPLLVTNYSSNDSFLVQQAPLILSGIMTVAMWGIILIAIMSTLMLPRPKLRPVKKIISYGLMVLQWAIFPATMIIFGSIPAIDAQTRLMLGKYLDFWVTEKKKTSDTGHSIGSSVQKLSS